MLVYQQATHIETMLNPQGKSQNVYYQAQDILARRDHSENEIAAKLARKGFSPAQIQNAIDWLIEKNLVDDRRFAAQYAEQILQSKPVGPAWIKDKLKRRGIETNIISQTVTRIFEAKNQADLVRQAAASWQRVHPAPDSQNRTERAKYKQKLIRHLASRGFSYEAIGTVA